MAFFSGLGFNGNQKRTFRRDFLVDLSKAMVVGQLMPNTLMSDVLKDAFTTVDRSIFVPACTKESCYNDKDILLNMGKLLNIGKKRRFLLSPLTICKMIVSLGLDEGLSRKVLVVAGGTGYSAALFGKMGVFCTMVESCPELYEEALQNLTPYSIVNVEYSEFKDIPKLLAGSFFDFVIVDGGCVEKIPDFNPILKDDGATFALLKAEITATDREKLRPSLAPGYINQGNGLACRLAFCHGVKVNQKGQQKILFDAWAPVNEEFNLKREFEF